MAFSPQNRPASVFRMSAGWDHGESPPHGRLAVCLVLEAALEALLPSDVNIRENRENGKPEVLNQRRKRNAETRAYVRFTRCEPNAPGKQASVSRRFAGDANDLMEHSPDGETVGREKGRQRRKMRRLGMRRASLGSEDAECRESANRWFSLRCSAGPCRRTSGAGVNYWGGSIRRKNNLAPQVKQRVFDGVEKLAK